jgi:hypothetical protein
MEAVISVLAMRLELGRRRVCPNKSQPFFISSGEELGEGKLCGLAEAVLAVQSCVAAGLHETLTIWLSTHEFHHLIRVARGNFATEICAHIGCGFAIQSLLVSCIRRNIDNFRGVTIGRSK